MIGEALALTASNRRNRAVIVIVPKRGTIVIAEIELRQDSGANVSRRNADTRRAFRA